MARAKYKIGSLIKTTETQDAGSHVGTIDKIIITATGVEYGVTGTNSPVAENEIAAAFRMITPRALKPRTKAAAPKRAKPSAEARAN